MINGLINVTPGLLAVALEIVRDAGYHAGNPPGADAEPLPLVLAVTDHACRTRGLHPSCVDYQICSTIPQVVQRMNGFAPLTKFNGVSAVTMEPDGTLRAPEGPFEPAIIHEQWLPLVQWLDSTNTSPLGIGIENFFPVLRPAWYPFVNGDPASGIPANLKVNFAIKTGARNDLGNLIAVYDLARSPIARFPQVLPIELIVQMAFDGHSDSVTIVGSNDRDLAERQGESGRVITCDAGSVLEIVQAMQGLWSPDTMDQPEPRPVRRAIAVNSATPDDSFLRGLVKVSRWDGIGQPQVLARIGDIHTELGFPESLLVVAAEPSNFRVNLTNGVSREIANGGDLSEIPLRLLPKGRLSTD